MTAKTDAKTTLTYVAMIISCLLTGFMYEELHQYWLVGLVISIICIVLHINALSDGFDKLDDDFRELYNLK